MKLIEEDFEETYGMRPKIVGREYLLDIGTLLKKADEYPETLSKCDQVSVWYDNMDALSMMLTLNDSISKDVDTNGYMGIQCHTTKMSNIKKVSLSARGGGVVYGICMDGKTGICVDNYSLRGSPGLHLAQLSDRFMQKIAEERCRCLD